MAITPKPKKLLYKRAQFLVPPGNETLQSLLGKALKQLSVPADRHEKPDPNDPEFRLLNYTANKGRRGGEGHMLACEFVSYTKEGNVGTLRVTDGVTHYQIDEEPPPEGKEYLGGSVYFGTVNNHVVLVQTKGLSTRDLERHLNWFLRRSGHLAEDNVLSLDDNLPAESASMNDAQGLDLAAPVYFRPEVGGEIVTPEEVKAMQAEKKAAAKKKEVTPESKKESMRMIPVGRAWEAFKTFFGDGLSLPVGLNAEDMLKSGNMRVKLSLLWTNQRGEDASDFARQVAHQMRHVTDEFDYSIRTKSGSIGKKKFKPEHPCSIRWGKVRPDFDDVFPKMLEWLEKLLTQGTIVP